MIQLKRTNSENKDFIHLVKFLDDELAERDKEDTAFYSQFNNIDVLKHTVVAYKNGGAIGIGAFKKFNEETVEVKRMYVLHKYRREGIAIKILNELELWANKLSFKKCVLETGKRQFEAVNFYKKNGYNIIPNYDPYINIKNSVCFEKDV